MKKYNGENEIGMKFNNLTLIEDLGIVDGDAYGLYECDCGKKTRVKKVYVRTGHTKSCGCIKKGALSLLKEGDRFGQLTFIKEIGVVGKNRIGLFKCDCGEIVEKWLINVVYSGTKSCGHKVDNKGNVRKKYLEERNPELFSWSDYDDIFQII